MTTEFMHCAKGCDSVTVTVTTNVEREGSLLKFTYEDGLLDAAKAKQAE
jgi:hypothetical protein